MTARADAVEYARAFFEDHPPLRLDQRDLAYFFIASVLLENNPSERRRVTALEFLEAEIYPEGRRDSLVLAFTRKRPKRVPRRRRGGDPFAYKTRDLRIVLMIDDLCRKYDLKPLRSRAAKDKEGADSACSIAREALRLVGVHKTEAAVEKIWNERKNLWPAGAGKAPFPV
jgi:hypothetical protein